MSKKKKLIPELRFPEFKNEGEWNYDKIDNLFHLQDGYAFSSNAFTDSKQNSKQVIRITDINNQNKNADKVFVWEETVKILALEKHKVKKGDLLLSLTGAAGFNFFIWKSDDAYINQRTMKLNSKKKENGSLKVILEPLVHSKINEIGTGQNNNLSKDALKEIEFPFPNPDEQEKIASCLSSLDEVIAAHSQKLDLLQAHKNGLMQILFPQEGEKVPKYRFKGFDKDWKKVKLKDVSSYFNGGSYENDVKEDGKYELITLKSINTSGKLVNSKRYIDIEVPTLTKGTLIMILSEQAPGLLGMTAIIPTENKYVLNQRIAEIRPNNKVESYFLSMAINRNQVYFSKQGAGMKVQNISKPNVENYEFLVPEIPEQLKIASCLSALDELITAQTEKIEQLKQHKNGLMQGLFPKMIDI